MKRMGVSRMAVGSERNLDESGHYGTIGTGMQSPTS